MAYAELLSEGDLPDEALADAPVPTASVDEMVGGGLEKINERIADWARDHDGVEQRLIDRASGLNSSATRVPGGLGVGDAENSQDTGGDAHLGNAVENSMQKIRRATGTPLDAHSSSSSDQADE
jgi:hypothetical protein